MLVPVLLVLATIIGVGGAFAVWVNRQALNTSNWSSTSGKILADKQVQTAVSAYLVRELFSNVDVAGDVQKALPAQLAPLAGPAAAGLQQLAGQLAPRVLASPQAQAAWVAANVAAHKQLLKLLNGGGPVVSTQSGVVTVDLHALVDELAATLGVSSQLAAAQVQAAGIDGRVGPGDGAAETRDHAAADQRPVGDPARQSARDGPGHRERRQGPGDRAARDRARAVRAGRVSRPRTAPADASDHRLVPGPDRRGAPADPQSRRRRGRRWPGQGSVQQTGRARRLEHRDVAAVRPRGRADRVRAGDRGDRVARRPTRPATAIRKALAPSLRDSPAVAYLAVGGVLALVVLWGPTPALRNIWWILVFAALLALGVTMLRRETAVEFAGVEPGQALRDLRSSNDPEPVARERDTCAGGPRRLARAACRASRPRRDQRRRVPGRKDTRHQQQHLDRQIEFRWRTPTFPAQTSSSVGMSRFLREPVSVRNAASVIVVATVAVVVAGGVAIRILDHHEYSSIWLGMWWALQTVTTVGYGDVTPTIDVRQVRRRGRDAAGDRVPGDRHGGDHLQRSWRAPKHSATPKEAAARGARRRSSRIRDWTTCPHGWTGSSGC